MCRQHIVARILRAFSTSPFTERSDVSPFSTNQVTIVQVSPYTAPQSHILWRRAAEGLYAATLDGEFAGFVTIRGDEHMLHGPHAQFLGVYPSLDEACAVLDLEPAVARTPAAACSSTS